MFTISGGEEDVHQWYLPNVVSDLLSRIVPRLPVSLLHMAQGNAEWQL